jgi:serine/threonine protein kinase
MESKFSECAGMEVTFGSEQGQLGECLGEGAEGAVYELERFTDIVAKIFKQEKRENKQQKLETMVQDSMISPQEEMEVPWTAWPIDIVYQQSDSSFLGYVMPYLDTGEAIDAQRYASQNLRWEDSSQRQRYKPAINLVLTVYWLHRNGYAIGDLSEQNIRVNDGNVTLIDCDSYSIEGSEFAGQMESPRYTPPEGRGTSHADVKQTDQFGVAVHIFQFLMAGFHPYQAVGEAAVEGSLPQAIQRGDFPYGGSRSQNLESPPPAPEFAQLPRSVRRGFEQCFDKGHSDPNARPSLQKWLAILSKEGGFELDGIDLSTVTVETESKDRLGRNWQEDIRQGQDSDQAGSTARTGTTRTETATTTNSASDTHWADGLRDDQTARSGRKSARQSSGQQPASQPSASQPNTGQQSAGQRSASQQPDDTSSLVLRAVGVAMLLLMMFILLILIV